MLGTWGRTDIIGREAYSGWSYGAAGYGVTYGGTIDVRWQDLLGSATKKELNDPSGYLDVYNRWLQLNPKAGWFAKNAAKNGLYKEWKKLAKVRVQTSQSLALEAQGDVTRQASKQLQQQVAPQVASSPAEDAVLASLLAPTPPPMMATASTAVGASSANTMIYVGLGTAAAVGLIVLLTRGGKR